MGFVILAAHRCLMMQNDFLWTYFFSGLKFAKGVLGPKMRLESFTVICFLQNNKVTRQHEVNPRNFGP